ncbi:RTC4-like domain-containing protein, partial [Trametes maxima]
METQMLESLHQIPSAKRSAAGSDVEREHGAYRKKLRRDSHQSVVQPMMTWRAVFLDPSVDPATLCPWCDEPLPTNPTPHLASLLSAARRRSYPDERPTNPLGLRASPTVFVGVCQRHRFERVWIPRASKRGWPTSIDWNGLRGRVEKLKEKLKSIVDDVDQDFAPHTKGKGKQREESGSRRTNEFWQELVKNVKEQGSRQTTGVRGQFLHFNKTQPGYYGELGYMIVHQTLCNLFPPTTFDAAAALPLTPADFISHVLVPEAALNLIMEDLNLSRGDALRTLRESVEYGVAMFPADEGEGGKGDSDVLGVGEKIVMERARARRKELEEEERREEEE